MVGVLAPGLGVVVEVEVEVVGLCLLLWRTW